MKRTVREFRVGLSWSFAPDQLDSVLEAIALLPRQLQAHCVYEPGLIEFDVETMAASFDDAKQFLMENVVGAVGASGLSGEPTSAYVTDDVSHASWTFANGRLVD